MANSDCMGWYDCNNTTVSNNVMGYNKCRRYFSPLQIATMRRNISSDNGGRLQKTLNCQENEGVNTTINQNTTWSINQALRGDLIVTNNSILTITCRVNMPPQAKISVEPGSRLIVDGGIITNQCGYQWQGIEVHGNRNLDQTLTNQGLVYLKNNAIIEHARTAIATRNGSNGWTYNGGIIVANNTTFRNNHRDIEFLSYHRHPIPSNPSLEVKNASSFTDCIFETDDNFLSTNPEAHITMWDVNGIRIRGCTFVDNRTTLPYSNKIGVRTLTSSYLVSNSTFDNMGIGISSTSQNNILHNIKITGSDFNCHRSIYLAGLDFATVKNCTINTQDYYSNDPYGIYLNYCQDYDIEENNLTNAATNPSVGIAVHNNHGFNTEIYKNTLTGYYIGVDAMNQNKGEIAPTGLEIRCNDFYNSYLDITSLEDNAGGLPVMGIRNYQGNTATDELADNRFANTSPNLYSNYYNECEHFTYIFHNSTLEPRFEPSIYHTPGSTITLFEKSVDGKDYPSACPTNTPGPFGGTVQKKSLAKSQLTQVDNQIKMLVDDGKTPELKNEVINADAQTAYDVYTKMMNISGYVSKEVLVVLSEKEVGFTNAMIRNVLVANEHSAKSKKIKEKLDNRTNLLPPYMRDQIDQGLTQLSALEFLESQAASYKGKLDNTVKLGIIDLLGEETIQTNKVKTLLSNVDDIAYELKKIQFYDATGQPNKVQQVINGLSDYTLTSKEVEDVQDFLGFRELLNTWDQTSVDLQNLSQSQIDELIVFSEKSNPTAMDAMALLLLNEAIEYDELILFPNVNKSATIITETIEEEMEETFMLLFPNPANQYVTVRYTHLEPFKQMEIKVFDINGREVHKQKLLNERDEIIVPLNKLTMGTYIVKLTVDGKAIQTKNLIVHKE